MTLAVRKPNSLPRVCGLLTLITLVLSWSSSDCSAVGLHGGGGGGMHGGGMPMPRGGFPGASHGPAIGGGFSPSMGSFGGARPPAMNRPDFSPGNVGGMGGLDHGALPGFPHAGGSSSSRPGGGATASQLSSFLGLPASAASREGGPNPARPGPSSLPNGLFDRGGGAAWPAGHAGNRPDWAGQAGSAGDLAARMQNAVQPGGPHSAQLHDWLNSNPQRAQQWQERGDQIRQRWQNGDHPPLQPGKIPGSDWWSKYHPQLDNWYYHHDWHHHGWAYWWGTPTWVAFGSWFPAWGWAEPVFYDYGVGGNVIYQNQNVYVNGQDVGTTQQYAQSAADLATVDPQQSQSTPDNEDWMALGTFAVVTSEKDTSPTRILQLAVDHQGIVSGTMHNSSTNQDYVVQGRVDKSTQRVAFTIGDKNHVVMETGIYNLTQQQTPVLVHYGTDRTENYLLVRLSPPAADGQAAPESGSGSTKDNPLGS